jgi:hypothetical protein
MFFFKSSNYVSYLLIATEKEAYNDRIWGQTKTLRDLPTKVIFLVTKDFYGYRLIFSLAEPLQAPFPPSTLVTTGSLL